MYPNSYIRQFFLYLLIVSVCALSQPTHQSYPRDSAHKNGSCTLSSGQESHEIGTTTEPQWPWQIYKSAPYNPPELEITSNGRSLSSGLLFISPSDASSAKVVKEDAVLIMTDAGQLVWNGPNVVADNFRIQTFEEHEILTYWSGGSTSAANVGHGYGNITFLDSSYNEILVVCPKLGLVTNDNKVYQCEGDLHESFVTDRDTLLVTAYNVTTTDLSSIGGPVEGWVYDCLFYEIEPRSGKILFSWSALEHVAVQGTKQPLLNTGTNQSNPFDWFHINSVVNIGDTYLVNSRHLWTTYLVTATGDVSWTLQGDDGGDFGPLPANGRFSWQHFARPQSVTNTSITLTFFNNDNSGVSNGTHPSNLLGLQLALPPNNTSPPIVLSYRSSPQSPIYADSQGSHTILPNGNVLGGYGQIPVIREFGPNDPSGIDLRWSARFGPDNLVQSYRAYKQEWHAKPTTIPSLVVEFAMSGCSTGYVSWNGATDVSAWEIFEGSSADELVKAGKVGFMGFETKFSVSGPCVQVAAVAGKELTRSNITCRNTTAKGTGR